MDAALTRGQSTGMNVLAQHVAVVAGGTDTATSAGYGLSTMNDGSSVRALRNINAKQTMSTDVRAR